MLTPGNVLDFKLLGVELLPAHDLDVEVVDFRSEASIPQLTQYRERDRGEEDSHTYIHARTPRPRIHTTTHTHCRMITHMHMCTHMNTHAQIHTTHTHIAACCAREIGATPC